MLLTKVEIRSSRSTPIHGAVPQRRTDARINHGLHAAPGADARLLVLPSAAKVEEQVLRALRSWQATRARRRMRRGADRTGHGHHGNSQVSRGRIRGP